jgi:hypothetical protein
MTRSVVAVQTARAKKKECEVLAGVTGSDCSSWWSRSCPVGPWRKGQEMG